ncbi:hypothetical protein BDZ94DRAFT_704376 [Collybia nuda]|uniref:Uncharacterized protein n=1 Tax=Collybia nuda TaxID=64659 RepID=A0A9P5Y7H1_9AGAR|nr:hypothetical protein BDZ94DRAFT_704376 [Collybia nuda]
MPNSGEVDGRPHNGHLGTTWEIAIVTVFVVLVFIIIGTVVFQIRRKQRRRREEEEMLDEEAGTGKKGAPSKTVESRLSDKHASPSVHPKPPKSSHRHSTTPSSSSSYPDHPSKKPPRYYWDHR